MAETAKFMSKHHGYITYVNGEKVVFDHGNFSTSDPKIIEGLRKSSDFGLTLIEVKESDLKEKEVPETAPEAPAVKDVVQEELGKPAADAPIPVSKHAKGKKR